MAARPARSTSSGSAPAGNEPARLSAKRVSLVDLLDRVLAGGVVITGEITLSVADVDLVTVSLRALLSSVSSLLPPDDDASPADTITVAPDGVGADW